MWKALGALALVLGLVLLFFAVLHTGIWFEPVIVPAVVVETICGTGLVIGGVGALRAAPWAWNGLVYAYAAALGGVLLGVLALALFPGPGTSFTDWYHRGMAAVLALGLGGSLYASRERR
ncbi:hypothetical protein OIE66_08130 [Nonomuraea sp. NBC_01738]|uniref:hypothetical protein n=1 Tax=Nonomuraea sp. NBC_01738 TaxID=2976003 RepID=UPI002E145C38|nr:hypothetical protein OIE66_08130 [Nonomuraea sp. NBC_01738]